MEWPTRDDFLNDPDTTFDGYLYVKDRIRRGLPVDGLLIFTHRSGQCGTTLAISASRFKQDE
jgi:hypothetical protein